MDLKMHEGVKNRRKQDALFRDYGVFESGRKT